MQSTSVEPVSHKRTCNVGLSRFTQQYRRIKVWHVGKQYDYYLPQHKGVVGVGIYTYCLPSLVDSWFSGIVGWSGSDQHYAYAYARLVLPTCFAHRWLVGVSFSNFSWTECGYVRSLRRGKQHQLDKLSLWFWCIGKDGSCSARSSHVKLATTK